MDIEFEDILKKEIVRQNESIVLIASENYASKSVRIAQGSIFTNKYAEGYPGKRYYGGCEYVDQIEILAIQRAKELFGAEQSMYNLTVELRQIWQYIQHYLIQRVQ